MSQRFVKLLLSYDPQYSHSKQTSITIDDIVYVIDAGKVKETQFDPDMNLSRLVETWVNRAAARQRRGRAGRTRPGVCYKLYTRKQEVNMAEFPVPEILRVPLESISLSVKAARADEDVKVRGLMYITDARDSFNLRGCVLGILKPGY